MTVSILGCGWLGLSLAKSLIRKGHSIKGSTTSRKKIPQLKEYNIKPFLVKLTPELEKKEEVQDFWQADVLVLNIPPGRGRENVIDYHSTQIQAVIEEISDSPIHFVIFVSSTSVYPSTPGLVKEKDARPGNAVRESGNALIKAEQLLLDSDDFETTVVRFGGLYGGDRHPVRYMAGRKNLGKASAPVNLIHRDDCISIISKILEKEVTGEIFNAVCDEHPSRKEYYTAAAKSLGLEPPTFRPNESGATYKVVSNKKLKEQLPYTFIYPEPLLPEPQ